MSGRTRVLVALLLLAALALVPAPDAGTGRVHLTHLRVREWLLDPMASPLAAWVDRTDRLPPLVVELFLSPPIEDPVRLREERARYGRLVREWAQARSLAGQPTRVHTDGPALLLVVRAGTEGLHALLAQPAGPPAELTAPYPSRWSLLPAVLAIAIAIAARSVLSALLLGGLAGAVLHVATMVPGATVSPLAAVWRGVRHYGVDALWQRSIGEDFYLRITLFVMFLFMTIGVVTRNGGIHGLVVRLQRQIRGPVSAQLVTFVCGLLIFFDDYSNCLLTGTTMRPLTDQRRVSREKLAYLVDSTAAPVAGLSVFSTWVVYEMSQYRLPLAQVTRADGTPYTSNDTFEVFLASLPFRYYSLFALGLCLLVVLLRRDFGPMLVAERRARRAGAIPAAGTGGLVDAGPLPGPPAAFGDRLRHLLAHARSDQALFWAACAAYSTALTMTLAQRLLRPAEVLLTSLRATKALVAPIGILFLAWTLGHVCHELGTSIFLTALVQDAVSPTVLPLSLFAIAGAIAFATGTSFGTMAILLPNVVVLAHEVGTAGAFTGDPAAGGPALMLLCIAAVLEGAIFGDHCSPISDTTVLSSLGTQCDHLAHVATQLPYALLGAITSLVCGYVPMVTLGPSWWPLALVFGLGAMALFLLLVGRDPDAADDLRSSA